MSSKDDIMLMDDSAWRQRLKAAIDGSGKTMRKISLAAGCGAGYVQSILGGKDPTLKNLLAVCDQVPVSAIYVIYGFNAKPGDEAILKAIQDNPEKRDAIIALVKPS